MANSGNTHDALDAIFFHFGDWDIRTYSITMLLGMLVSIGSIWYFWRREKYSSETLLLLIIVVIPCSIIGARLWYVMGRPSTDTNPWYAVWDGGLAIQGAVLAALLGGIGVAYFYRNAIDIRKAFSLIVPNILIGQVIGRWGNFANHEVFGTMVSNSNLDWLGRWISMNMWFTDGNTGTSGTGFYAPLFLYESIINLFGWILLVWIFQTRTRRKWFKPGTVGGLYFIWYGIVRAILEPLRNPSDILSWHIFGFYVPEASFVTAILYIIAGIVAACCFQFIPSKYVWNDDKYTWEISVKKISKRKLNSGRKV